jgi:ubiquinone biosynthesis protein
LSNWPLVARILLFLIGLVALGTVTSRLLGVRLSWRLRVVASILGSGIGGAVTYLLLSSNSGVNIVPVTIVLHLFFTMVIAVLIELATPPGRLMKVESDLLRLPNPVGALRQKVSRARRYAQVTWIIARHGLGGYLEGRMQSSVSTPASAAAPSPIGASLRDALQEAGGLFIKLGQMLSTRSDLLPPAVMEPLSVLQDRVSPAPREEVEALLAEELRASPHAIFAKFEDEPVAAASMAQVHRAWLRTGERVAVKVQRPNIRASAERDLDIINSLAQTVESYSSWGKTFHAVDLAAGFAESIHEELDFQIEARNTALIASFIRPDSPIRVPRVYQEFSNRRLLVVEWMDGVPVRDALRLVADAGLDRQELARALLRFLLRQIMVDGVFHGDPHPGNVMVLRNGQVALIDWGSMGRLDLLQQAALRNLLIGIQRRDASGVRGALLDMAEYRAGVDELDEERLERAVAHLLARRLATGMPMSTALFIDLFRLLYEFGMGFPGEIAAVFRSVLTLEGTLRLLAPGFDMIEEARTYAQTLVQENLTVSAISKTVQDEVTALAPLLLHRLPRRIDRISASMERGTFTVSLRMFADVREQRFVAAQVGRQSMALMGSVIGLMSVFLLNGPGGPLLLPSFSLNDGLGYMGLFSGVTLMMRVVVAVSWERIGE